jgi:hypothetical protein
MCTTKGATVSRGNSADASRRRGSAYGKQTAAGEHFVPQVFGATVTTRGSPQSDRRIVAERSRNFIHGEGLKSLAPKQFFPRGI